MRLSLTYPLLLLSSLALWGCHQPMNLLQSGDIERAYAISKKQVERLAGRGKPSRRDELEVLAAAYTLLQEEQIQRLEELEAGREPGRWLELYPLYQRLLARRSDIDPYLPLLPRLNPVYDLPTLQALTERARLQAGAYCEEQAQPYIAVARRGSKAAARVAFVWLDKGLDYTPEAAALQAEWAAMRDLGTMRVLLAASHRQGYGEGQLAEYLLRNQAPQRFNWLEVHFAPSSARFDYVMRAEPVHVYVGWDEERSHSVTYCKEVQEGTRTIEKQVRVNDSTVVVVKEQIPIIITVCGTVTTVERYKYASASLDAWLESPEGEQVRSPWRLERTCEWANRFEVCSGDSRALPVCMGISSMFPSDWSMIRDLASLLRRELLADLRAAFPEESGDRRRARR
jgi:hypothetical protein